MLSLKLNEPLDLGNGLAVVSVDPSSAQLREQDKNAQFMPPEEFNQLVANIKRRGALESVPYCAVTDNGWEIISGHHRVRAAAAAGLKEIVVLLDSSGLPRSLIHAKQLAHNALTGKSDVDIVREIIALIDNVDDLIESFVGVQEDSKVAGLEASLYPSVSFEWQSVAFTFLPPQFDDFQRLIKTLGPTDLLGVSSSEQFDKFSAAVRGFSRIKNVVSIGTTIALLTKIALEQIEIAEAEAAAAAAAGEGEAPTLASDTVEPGGQGDTVDRAALEIAAGL
jgi:hypothetical protein